MQPAAWRLPAIRSMSRYFLLLFTPLGFMINFYFYFISLPFTFNLPILYTILCSACQYCVHGNHAGGLYHRAGVALMALERQEVR